MASGNPGPGPPSAVPGRLHSGEHPAAADGAGDLALTVLPVRRDTAKFDLNLTTLADPRRCRAGDRVRHRPLRPCDHRGVVRPAATPAGAAWPAPDCRIDDLPFLGPDEVRTQCLDWNHTETAHPGYDGRTLVDLLAEQVTRTPQAPAVTSHASGVTLTYADLDARANALAHRLQAQGVGPDDVVGMCLQRHEDMVIAIVAILKAGAAYVLVDRRTRRAAGLDLRDAACRVVLCHRRFATAVPADLELIALDELDDDDRAAAAPTTPVGPANLAYVMTPPDRPGGRKGVQIEHGSIVNLLAWRQRTYPMGPGDTLFHKTPITFDPSVWQFLWPLITGARLLLATPEGSRTCSTNSTRSSPSTSPTRSSCHPCLTSWSSTPNRPSAPSSATSASAARPWAAIP